MRLIKSFLCLLLLTAVVSCKHKQADNSITSVGTDAVIATGTLELQGPTTYQYGTHKLIVTSSSLLVLESTTIDLNSYIGMHVKITAINTYYQAELGPDLYNVTAIVPE